MKPGEIRSRTKEEIVEELRNTRRELFNMRFQWQTEEIANSAQYGSLRRDIARMKTVLREMELGVNTNLLSRAVEEGPAEATSEDKE